MKTSVKILAVALATLALVACGSKYDVKVDLAPEEIAAAKAEIDNMQVAIKNFIGPQGEIPALEIIRLAKAYEKLGKFDKAIDLYVTWLEGRRALSLVNNLGRLYEQVGEVELAVRQYQRIIDEYFDPDYLYDITWAYIHGAQKSKGKVATDYRKKAEKYFNIWQLEKKKTDEQTQAEIKRLREVETAAKAN
jgi:tetratricopeptide (TPR) repeat protein